MRKNQIGLDGGEAVGGLFYLSHNNMYESENRDKGTISNNSNQTVDEHMHQIQCIWFL